ncbi:MAG: SprT family zinc-dependent metalloprotease [Pseudomonadota bacterium]
MTISNTSGLPHHSVRISKKARRITLRMVAGKGLEVVLPQGTPMTMVPDILTRHAAWIEKQLAQRPQIQDTSLRKSVPKTIFFALTQEFFEVQRIPCSDESIMLPKKTRHRFNPEPGVVLLPADDDEALKKLRAWFLRVAKSTLLTVLEDARRETGLDFTSFGVGLPRTRWGSCTYKKGIRLNARLMFVAPELARSVAIHELCHTVHLHHGPKFHALVQKFDAEEWTHHKALKEAERTMPTWAY